MTTEQTQHARDSAELRRLCSERDQLREKVAEQAREIERLQIMSDNYCALLMDANQELADLKAQPSAAVPDSVVWIDAHHIQPGNNPSFIRDVALVSAVKTTETQVPLVRLNSSPVSARCKGKDCGATDGVSHSAACIAEHEATVCAGGADERAALSAFTAWGESIGLSPALQTVGELKAFKAGAEWKARAALSANHSEQVREWVPVSERLPETKAGTNADFIVAIRRAHNGKTYVVPASFLNRFELYSEDEAADDEGRIYVTGWYREMADDEYDTSWHKMETEGDLITHWQELPAAPSAGSQKEQGE